VTLPPGFLAQLQADGLEPAGGSGGDNPSLNFRSRLTVDTAQDVLHAALKLHELHEGAQIEATVDPSDGTTVLGVTWTF
jgi:hypothetical protein